MSGAYLSYFPLLGSIIFSYTTVTSTLDLLTHFSCFGPMGWGGITRS